jgi:hypothetical protein
MGVSLIRPNRFNRNRRSLPGVFFPAGSAIIAAITIVAGKARLTLSAPVSVAGLPVEITRQAAGAGPQLLPTAVTIISPTVFDLTYAAAVVATDVITIPANVPLVRGYTGGALQATTVTL